VRQPLRSVPGHRVERLRETRMRPGPLPSP
jgi:hypothetical protein